jgi:RHS repeat-associated protein
MILNTKKILAMGHTVAGILKAISFKAAVLVICLVLFFANSRAGNTGGIEDLQAGIPLKGTVAVAAPNQSYPLVSGQSSIVDYNTFPLQTTQQSKTIKNIITFGINEEAGKFISQDFTITANVLIEYGHSSTALNSITKSFTLSYKKAEGIKYDAKQYFSFADAEYVKITLQSLPSTVINGLDIREVLVLQNEMLITRYFELPAVVPGPYTFNFIVPDLALGTPDHLGIYFSWPLNTGNNATQLEWAWVENEMEEYYKVNGTLNYDLIFLNSTRVDLPYKKVDYDIPLLYDGAGKLYYRIRAVNIKETGNRSDGPWNMAQVPYAFAGHNNNLNWQSTSTFAEEGKRKSVIQYYDGSLRGRQTVTKDNSTNTVVTAESFYDAQGRPAIQILPTPGIGSIIKYQANLNLFNGQAPNQDPADIFDMEPVATPNSLTPPLLTSSGSSNYYSFDNPDKLTGSNKNIPNADGYPYTVTRYTPDGTGRVMTQSGVGDAHKMGNGHETKYYYGNASQEELDGLFGTEAGHASHYSKNMVKDANGQMSVSYTDMHGRTVATALAGDAPAALQALDNKTNPLHYPSQAGTAITRNLLDNTTNIIKGNTIESVNSLLVPALTNYDFTYGLNPQILEMAACKDVIPAILCYDCLYDLEITITDETGETAPIVRKFSNVSLTPDDDCSTPITAFEKLPSANVSTISNNVISFPQTLLPGSYSIRKTLSISENSLQKYKDLYMSKAVCKTEQQLIDSVYNVLLSTSNCASTTPVTCDDCIAQLGSENNYRIQYRTALGLTPPAALASTQIENDITLAYNQALQNCNRLCNNTSQALPSIRKMMLADMVPYSGQYAQENIGENISPANGAHTMFDKFNIFSTYDVVIQPFYKYPINGSVVGFYKDEINNTDITIHPNPAAPYALLNNTTPATFTQLFKNSWASSLLYYHPEYERLVFAENQLKASYEWINKFTKADYTEALAKGYCNPVGIDPYFIKNPADINAINAVMSNYKQTNVSIWQLAFGDIRCKSINDFTLRGACYATPANNTPPPNTAFTPAENAQAWELFRGLYAAERNRYVNAYIAASKPLTATDEIDLIDQKFRLWFPRNDQQVADQNGGSEWWPTIPGEGPTGGVGTPTTTADRCNSYINRWKEQLLKCDALANDPNKDAILTEITTRMQTVCENGSNQANPYGASNVAPNTPVTVTDRSFEDVIKNVFIARNIIGADGIYTDNYCNPFVIEWPKPYGKGPKIMAGEATSQIEECNCKQYGIVKEQAIAQNVNVNNLADFNQFLLANHGDVLTAEMFAALQQQCGNLLLPECICIDLDDVIDLYHIQYPDGGLDPCPPPIPANLQIDLRINNQPDKYIASNSITFLPGFETGLNDQTVAYIDASGTGCDPAPGCRDKFVNFFNNHYGYNPPFTWTQIVSKYQANCGHQPYVCGYTDYSCSELLKVVCNFHNLKPSYPIYGKSAVGNRGDNSPALLLFNPCLQVYNNFTDFFNHYYHNIVPLTWQQIQDLYAACDPELPIHICNGNLPVPYCGGPVANCAGNLPYTLPKPLPLPDFLKCGYVKNPACISCAGLSTLTGEYKNKFAPQVSNAPIFTGTNLTRLQVQYNMNYARFINYRTGYQFGWLDYSKAAAIATPACNLADYNNNGTALQNVICGSAKPLADINTVPVETPCQKVYTIAITLGQQIYKTRQQYLLQQFDAVYTAKCLAAKNIEQFKVDYYTSEYHYTLYYYDMAGNLVKTVPPKGVKPNFSGTFTNSVKNYRNNGDYSLTPVVPAHTFATQYCYNSLGQVIAQTTPDAGTSNFWYDALGRLVVSQNAQQFITNKYSYTLYDALGRISEVGQKPQAANSMSQAVSQIPASLNAWINTNGGTKEQITYTVYDEAYPPLLPAPTLIVQQNLRNRVSYTATKNLATDAAQAAATFYTYDIHGNVDKLLQDYNKATENMAGANSRYKFINYDYDLISGKVNRVSYQDGQADAFYHRYYYDAENRLTSTETSRDKIVWERDAAYTYFKHGPLARTELGKLGVQGIDYAYTIHGWLKGINQSSLNPAKDIGKDGTPLSVVARDILSYGLYYYGNTTSIDYAPIGGISPFAFIVNANTIKSLYNGNIAAMGVNNAGLLKANAATNNTMPLLYSYQYDQLNRIVGMQANKGLDVAPNQWNAIAIDDYKEAVSYDPNGNILTYDRNGAPSAGMPKEMDAFKYDYDGISNKLLHVGDNPAFNNYYSEAANGTADIDDQPNPANYTYDAIGNLVGDVSEGISSINWSVYGKILNINKATGNISYTYDASGNRISKTAAGKTTIYVRDASGNVMSVYESVASSMPAQKETHLYGSSRLGLLTQLTTAPLQVPLQGGFATGLLSTFTRGEKIFELSNHLGNVLATVSDKKIGVDDGTYDATTGNKLNSTPDGKTDYYTADVVTANDYYPFGMQMPGRSFSSGSKYRYGFNGQEKSTEINESSYTAEFWQYDARLGRRWNVDPVTKTHESPYACFSNNPIINVDPHGDSDSTATSPNGGSFTLPESAKVTKQSFAYTNASGVNFQHSDGAVESFNWQDKEYKANYNSKTGEFTGYKAQLGESHNFQKIDFSYGPIDKLIERVMASSSSGPSNPLEEYRARRAYPGYLPGESRFDKFCRNVNNSHIEEMLDFGGGGYNMFGGYGRAPSVISDAALVQRASTFADGYVPFTKSAGVTGTLKHTAASRFLHLYQLRNGNRGLQTAQYFNNNALMGVGNRGFLDVVNHRTMTIFDFKFGNANWNPGQLQKYQRNFVGYGIDIVRPR